MERRAHAFEHLDGSLEDRETLAGNLRDLRRVNRCSGGRALSRRGIDALVTDAAAPLRVLDVGTGAADIPVALSAAWRAAGRDGEVTAIDSRAEVIAAASAAIGGADVDGLHLRVADGRELPYADGAFDVAHASLVLHHLEPDEAIVLLGEMRRVARLGIGGHDLARGRLAGPGAGPLAHPPARSALPRGGAPPAGLRAHTLTEARRRGGQAGT